MTTSKLTLAAAASMLIAGAALAQTSGTPSGQSGQQMSQAECQSIWSKADAQSAGSLTQTQAQSYVTDFKSADANNDGRLSSTEFQSACQRGLVRSSAATGTGTGGSGMGGSGATSK